MPQKPFYYFLVLIIIVTHSFAQSGNPKICFTFDDAYPKSNLLFSSEKGNLMVLESLEKYDIQAAFFVKADILQSKVGKDVVEEWDKRGHMICNHSYSHLNYHSEEVNINDYKKDFLLADSLLSGFKGFTRLYRFPFLREGNTLEKRDQFRKLLDEKDYKTGYVTIDNTEWLINSHLRDRLCKEKNINIDEYKRIYVNHLFCLAQKYDTLGVELTGRRIPQVMLIHNNVTSALFLGDLIQKFVDEGCDITDAEEVFSDPIYKNKPDVIWQRGQSLLFSIAKEKGLLSEEKTFNLLMEEILIAEMEKLGL